MYQLYYSKKDSEIKIDKLKKVFQGIEITDEVKYYNDCFYFCSDRKKLKEKAIEIKNEWISEARIVLEKYESIEI